MNITPKELELLVNIAESNYVDGLDNAINDGTWTICLGTDGPFKISARSVSGRVSSCLKKGLVLNIVEKDPKESIVRLTEKGAEVYRNWKEKK